MCIKRNKKIFQVLKWWPWKQPTEFTAGCEILRMVKNGIYFLVITCMWDVWDEDVVWLRWYERKSDKMKIGWNQNGI